MRAPHSHTHTPRPPASQGPHLSDGWSCLTLAKEAHSHDVRPPLRRYACNTHTRTHTAPRVGLPYLGEGGEEVVPGPGEDHVVVDVEQHHHDHHGEAHACNTCSCSHRPYTQNTPRHRQTLMPTHTHTHTYAHAHTSAHMQTYQDTETHTRKHCTHRHPHTNNTLEHTLTYKRALEHTLAQLGTMDLYEC